MKFANVKASLDSLGPGDLVGGYPTQHYRITTKGVLTVAFDGMEKTLDRQTTTEYWLADIPAFPPSPVWKLVGGIILDMEGMSKETSDLVAPFKMDRPFGKVALKTTVSLRASGLVGGLNGNDRTTEITGIKSVEVDLARLVLPDGMSEAPLPGMEMFVPAAALRTKDGGAGWRGRAGWRWWALTLATVCARRHRGTSLRAQSGWLLRLPYDRGVDAR